jgi:predicted enzyme related to lactoylglutathione lyase
MSSHGHFHWNELMAHDVGRARKFYEGAIGWSFEAMPMAEGTYWLAKAGDKPVGGIFEMKSPHFDGVPERWVPYIAVDDVDARVKKAVAAGAKVMRPPFDIPKVGRIAYLHEPGGAAIAWITPTIS